MKIAVFLPTKRKGGIDVIEASLLRQTYRNFIFLVCDEHERDFYWRQAGKANDVETVVIQPPYKPSNQPRNLAKTYNLGIEYALDYDCDLFVSLQDYIWVPEDGLERFVKNFDNNGPKNLYTGLTSISADPEVDQIYDLEAAYTIFEEPYRVKPQVIDWVDARATSFYQSYFDQEKYILEIDDPNHFEANWAAIPVELLKQGLKWDEDYDKGIAFENNQLALDAIVRYDCRIILDGKNHAISLPHRKYFEEGEIGSEGNTRNMNKYQANLQEARNATNTT